MLESLSFFFYSLFRSFDRNSHSISFPLQYQVCKSIASYIKTCHLFSSFPLGETKRRDTLCVVVVVVVVVAAGRQYARLLSWRLS